MADGRTRYWAFTGDHLPRPPTGEVLRTQGRSTILCNYEESAARFAKGFLKLSRHDPMPRPLIQIGTGIYGQAQAARLLAVSPTRLRLWVNGYTYWYAHHRRVEQHARPPVVNRDLPIVEGIVALSFVELMELRVVKALVDKGVSLQTVRRAATLAAETFGTQHPLAYRQFYTDGNEVFAALDAAEGDSANLVELSRRRFHQIIADGIFEQFLEEIDFNETTALATRWWPLGRETPVVLDPAIAFGAPTVQGTAIRTSTLERMASSTPKPQIASAFDLTTAQVEAAIKFEHRLAA